MKRTSSPRHLRQGLVAGLAALMIAGPSADAFATTSGTGRSPVTGQVSPSAPKPPRADSLSIEVREPGPRSAKAKRAGRAPKTHRSNNSRSNNSRERKGIRGGRAAQSKRSRILRKFQEPTKPKKADKRPAGSKKGKINRAGKLRVPRGLRRTLGDLYYQHVRNEPDVRRRDVVGPLNIRYGKVFRKGGHQVVFYAVGDTALFGELFDPRVLPHVWRKAGVHGKWKYLGGTPRGLCRPGLVPRRLANAWDMKCT